MKVCGVELKGNDAIICVMSLANGLYDLPRIRVPKIAINDAGDAEQMQKFQFTIEKLLQDYAIDKVVIKGRAMKGKFAGGPVGFKLEAAIQLLPSANCEIVSSNFIKQTLAKTQLQIDFRDTGLKKFQEGAFQTAFAFLEHYQSNK
ncbi:DUF3010 family protein [Thalassotalea agarivorans]|uniref:DUF3010 domain-containing protein n=1 Tax=Thalassotalea agarivorans TaxID=349064 RepID=A0A1H9YR86_THASX|nr:DUF3010 family protein [Thalassotalea agarivorans]SES71637.1 Protein of unknown function [Thalassotalea agarivorans]